VPTRIKPVMRSWRRSSVTPIPHVPALAFPLWVAYVGGVGTKELIRQAASMPVEERALVVDSILRTLHAPDAANDEAWAEVAERRLRELRSGSVQGVSGDEVFAKARKRMA